MRKILLTLAITLLLALPAVSAQDDGDYCGSLSETDCALLYSASNDLPSSSNFDGAISTIITADGETVAFDIELSGGYVIDTSQAEDAAADLQDTTLLEFNMGDALDLLEGNISSFDAELFITVNLPEDSVPPVFQSVPLDLWLVDGVGYIDLAPAAILAPDLEGIYGMSIVDAARFGLSSVTIGDLQAALEDIGEDFDGDFGEDFGEGFSDSFGGDEDDPFSTFQNQLQLTDEEAMAFADEILTISRLDDTEIDGETIAVFEIDFDLEALLLSDAFVEGFELNAPDDVSFTGEEFGAALADSLSDDSNITFFTYVAVEDGLSYGFESDVNISLDPAPLAEFSGEEPGEEEVGPVEITSTTSFLRRDVDAVEAIILPDNAVIVTVEELIEQFMTPANPESDA